MDHHQAFLSDIVAHPTDDAPRLVYADWIEDQGEEARAEFIRVQCRLAQLSATGPEFQALHQREKTLRKQHGKQWAEPLRGLVDEWEFQRGFIECVAVTRSHEAFRARMDEVFANHPIHILRVEGTAETVRLLAWLGYLPRLSRLDVKDLAGTDAKDFMDLLLEPQAGGLRSLLVEGRESSDMWDSNLLRLAQPGSLDQLTELGLALGTITAPPSSRVLAALTASSNLARLTRLHLPFTEFTLPVARLLAGSDTLKHLTHLDLGCAEVSEAGWRQLTRGPNIARLQWLGLFGARITGRDAGTDLEENALGQAFRDLLGEAADFATSDTFLTRWAGLRWA